MTLNRDTRIYVAGCGGMLGDAVYRSLAGQVTTFASDLVVSEPWLEFGDVRDFTAIRKSIREFQPHVIVNLAALTDLELCEIQPADAWATNALGAEHLAVVANELGATCIYVSTAGVFDGRQDSYSDSDTPNPTGVYARSKFHGESIVQKEATRHFVLRAGWMMGGGPAKDKKFINKIYRQLCEGKTELFVVNDKVGTPTYTEDFAQGMCRLLESDLFGLYNHSAEGRCTRLEVAAEFVRLLGLSDTVTVTEVDSTHFSTEYFAARPASEALVNANLRMRGLKPMRDWRVCLAEYAEIFVGDWRARRVKEEGPSLGR